MSLGNNWTSKFLFILDEMIYYHTISTNYFRWARRKINQESKCRKMKWEWITWSETKKNHTLVTKLLTHKDTAVNRAYPPDAALMPTMYLFKFLLHQTPQKKRREMKIQMNIILTWILWNWRIPPSHNCYYSVDWWQKAIWRQ